MQIGKDESFKCIFNLQEPEQLSGYSDYATGYKTEELLFNSWQWEKIYFLQSSLIGSGIHRCCYYVDTHSKHLHAAPASWA